MKLREWHSISIARYAVPRLIVHGMVRAIHKIVPYYRYKLLSPVHQHEESSRMASQGGERCKKGVGLR